MEQRKNNKTPDRELLAVIHALNVWRCYLEGSTFKVLTDHNPLCHLPTQPLLTRQQARWSEFLQQFRFGWEYKPRKDNPADSLSRLYVFKATPTTPRSKHYVRFHPQLIKRVNALGSTMVTPIQVKDLTEGCIEDPWFKEVMNIQPLLRHKGLWWKD
jgi:hypothetical protein